MIVKNLTKNKEISATAGILNDAFSQAVGLMFSKNKENVLIFKFNREKIVALHMLFVFYPIDVLFLNKNKIVVDKKENFRPFAFYKSSKKAMCAIELPDGAIKKSKTKIGDKIYF